MSGKLQQKTPAEFFAENRNIAGFDNVRHSRSCSGSHSARTLPPAWQSHLRWPPER